MKQSGAGAVTNLSLLASSVARRKLAVRTGHEGLAFTDGETIFVAGDDLDRALIAVVVQSALLANGSLDPKIVTRLFGRATPARRYLTLEARRAFGDLGYCVPRSVRTAVDDQWDGPASTSAHHSLQRALNGERVPPAPELFGTIRPGKLWRAGGGAATGASNQQSRNIETTGDPVPELEDDDSDQSKILKLFSQPIQWENWLFKLFRAEPGMRSRSKADAGNPGVDGPIDSMSLVTRVGKHATLVSAVPRLHVSPPADPAGDFRYPEWDWHDQAYRESWCHVGVFDPAPSERAGDFVVRIDAAMRRELARLGLAYRRHHRQHEGDGLDPDALVDFAVARAMGRITDPRVFWARLRTAHDLGVVVLLDASGSTAESNPEGASIWDRQRLLAANLVAALEELGDRVAAYGFRSRGRHQVSFLRIKDFDGRFDQSARRRLASLEPGGFTRIGAAIRHSVHLASTQAGTSNRLLVVISDGFPYDDDYQGTYAEHDARRALTEAIDQAVGCVCLTVGTSTDHATLERLWGHVSHVDLVEPADLGRHLLPLFGSALKAANERTRSDRRAGGHHLRIRATAPQRVKSEVSDRRTRERT